MDSTREKIRGTRGNLHWCQVTPLKGLPTDLRKLRRPSQVSRAYPAKSVRIRL